MRALRSAVMLAAVLSLAAACGSSPTSPSPPPSFVMSAGPYTLSIYAAARPPDSNPGISILACAGFGSGPQSIALPAVAERVGGAWVIRLGGSLAGSATHQGITVQINDGTGTTATVSAPTAGVTTLGGFVEGAVRFSSRDGSTSCSSNAWSLVRP